MRLTEHFDSDEFACHDGTPVPGGSLGNLIRLCEELEVLRAELGVPILIVSGYRTPTYNAKVGGAAKSEHCLASAADIAAHPFKPLEVRNKIESLIKAGKMQQGGLGIYAGWVHYDVRGHKARWDGRKGARG